MCKPCMFSYWPGVWQTCGAKRRERRLNGAALSLSGERLTRSASFAIAGFAYARQPRRLSLRDTNRAHSFFELDLQGQFVHNENTSQSALQQVTRRLFCMRPCSGMQIL